MKKLIFITAGGVVLICVLLAGSVYAFGNEHPIAVELVKTLRLPLASIDGSIITFADFYVEVAVLSFLFKDEELSSDSIKQKVWEKLRSDAAVRVLAHDLKVTATDDEVSLYLNEIVGDGELQEQLNKLYGSRRRMTNAFINPLVLEDGVRRELLLNNEPEEALRIREIQERIRNGESFAEHQAQLQTQYGLETVDASLVVTASMLSGSDLGVYIQDLSAGDVSDVIATYDGYRMYSVTAITDEPEQAWQLEELFIPANPLPQRLAEYRDRQNIRIYAQHTIPQI